MTDTLDAALGYAHRGWPVFPCHWRGEYRKRPLIQRGLHAATCNEGPIGDWWHRWPGALIGVPTGRTNGFVVLDVDVRGSVNGFDTLAELGFAILPDTPMVHTAGDGLHLYFEPPKHAEIRNTAGDRGTCIGPGLDWRGKGGYIIVPSVGSGYSWDPHCNLDTAPLALVPAALLPHVRNYRRVTARPTTGLSPYAEAALDSACRRIITASDGEQEPTLNAESFGIGTLAGAAAIPADFARLALIWAARQVRDFDHGRPWRAAELENKVNRAFEDGLHHPRQTCRA